MQADTQKRIMMLQPGGASFDSISLDGKLWQTDFLIRESRKYLRKIPKNALITFRSGLYQVDDVFLVPVLFTVGEDFDMLYETWWNYSNKYTRRNFEQMAKQEKINLHFCSGSKRERSIQISNLLKEVFQGYCLLLKEVREWSMKEFDDARERLYMLYNTPALLWDDMADTEWVLSMGANGKVAHALMSVRNLQAYAPTTNAAIERERKRQVGNPEEGSKTRKGAR